MIQSWENLGGRADGRTDKRTDWQMKKQTDKSDFCRTNVERPSMTI